MKFSVLQKANHYKCMNAGRSHRQKCNELACIFVISARYFLVLGQSQNVSCVAASGRGPSGRGQRSPQSVLESSQLSGARL